jgi:hypothetical protein
MAISGVSLTLSKSMNEMNSNSSTQDTDNSSGGWKYLTVQEGGYTYTYIVIGKNMKVLISQVAQGDKDQLSSTDKGKKSDDNKTGDNKVNAENNSTASNQAEQQNNNVQNVQENQISKKYGLLTLTAYHEKQMRGILKEMEEKVGGLSSVQRL